MRLVVKDLIPGRQYNLQFRSKSDGEVSEWGMTHRVTIGNPDVKPRIPENVSLESVGDSFNAKWNRVTHSEDGSPATDLAGYVIRFRNVVTNQTALLETTATSIELTFNLNSAFFTPVAGTVGVQVAAKTITGIQGDFSPEVITQNPPPNPVRNLTAEGVLEGIVSTWDTPLDLEDDFLEYRAYTSDNANFEISDTNRFWSGVALTAIYHTQDDSRDHYIKVVAVDKFESPSTVSTAGPVRPRTSTKVDVDPPPVPDNVSGEIEEHILTVTWDAVANDDNDLAGYQVGYRPTGTTAWMTTSVSHEENTALIQPITRYQDYDVRVRSHDFSFNYSLWSTIVKVDGEENVPPAVPTGLTVKGAITSAMVFWDANTEPDLAGYEVQFKADEAPTEDDPVFPTTGRTISFSENVTRDTNYYARVRAVDTAGLKSAWSAPAMGQVGFPPPPETSDGNPPASSPKPVVTGGLDALYVSWPTVDNADPVTYEVHVSATNNFTPVNGTKASELNGTATTIRTLPSGAALVVGTTYYVKTVAKDIDGAAAPSAQTSAALRKLTYPEVEPVLTDGNPPSSSPVATLRAGIGSIFAQWPSISNADPVTYEIHLGTSTGFTPGAATRVGETSSTFTTVQKLPNGNPLVVGTNYFVKVIAKDADGAASAGGASNGVSVEYVPTKDDIDGITDRIDDTITGSVIQYAVNNSETTAPTTGWSTSTPTRTPGSFIWFRTVITYADGSGSTSNPALLTGNTGAPGGQGIPGEPGADGTSLYTWLKYADTPTSGMSDSPEGKTYVGMAYNKPSPDESENYADYTWSLIRGSDGKGISTTVVNYAKSTNGTSAPTSGWGTTIPATVAGEYLWTRTVTTYTDDTTSTAYGVARHGATGSPGTEGRGITGTTVTYQKSNSGTVQPTTWLTTIPATNPGEWLWTKTTTTYTSAPLSVDSFSVAKHGETGQQGIPGEPGEDGTTTYTWVKYSNAADGTNPVDSPAGMRYIGLAFNKTTPNESTNKADYAWSLIQGPEGPQGIPGDKGDDGVQLYTWVKYADTPTSGMADTPEGKTYMGIAYNRDSSNESDNYADYSWSLIRGSDGKGISTTVVNYSKSTNGTSAPTSGWGTTIPGTVAGEYLWTRTVTTYTDDTTSTAYAVARHGATGNPGAAGRGITGTTVTYAKNNSGTVQPTSWQSTIPTTSPGEWLWTKTTTTYTSAPLSVDSFSVAKHGETGQPGVPGPPGTDGQTTYTWVKYAPNGSPTAAQMSDSPAGMTHIGLAFNKTTATESTAPADYAWSLIQGPEGPQGIPGPPGPDGETLYTWLKYADTPTSGMSDSPVGKTYMGVSYNNITATESTNYADYTWSLIRGADGADGKGISSTVVTYQTHSNGTTAPTGTWSGSPTATTAGQYLWTRTITTYTDNTDSTAYAVAAHGTAGAPGAPGRGITGTTVHYQKHTNGTTAPTGTWTTTIPATNPGEWLWTRTTTTYSAAPTSVVSYSMAKHGETGQQGIPGQPGADGTTTYTWVKYAPNGSPTAGQMSDLPANMTHIGLAFNKTTATESTNPSHYSWSLIQGADGADGVSITSITPFYRVVTKGAAKPAQPSGTGNPSGWTTTEPAFAMNTELYRTERILYSNNTASWTPVTKVAAYEGIDQVNTVAITADRRVRKDNRAPVVADGAGAPAGALWYEYGPATAPGTGTVLKQTWEWNGTNTWSPRGIDRTFIPQLDIASGTFGDLTGGRLVANSIGADKIDVNDLTANTAWMQSLTTSQAFIDNAQIKSANISGTLTIGQLPDDVATDADVQAAQTALEKTIYNSENLVDNPSRTLQVGRWTATGGGTFNITDRLIDGISTPGLESVSTGNTQNYSTASGGEHFPINPSKAYQVSVWLEDEFLVSGTQLYLGCHVHTANGATNSAVIPVAVSTGNAGSPSTNPYFMTTGSPSIGSPVRYIAYLMPVGTDPNLMKGLGLNVTTNFILQADARFGRIRVLNWSNTAGNPRKVWIGNPTVAEVDPAVVMAAAAAQQTAGAVESLTGGWTFPNTTEINGGAIRTRSITAEQLEANIIKVGTTLIEDGAITTGFIAADAIKATHIDTDAIEARHIKAGSITIGTVDGLQGGLDNAIGTGAHFGVNQPAIEASGAYNQGGWGPAIQVDSTVHIGYATVKAQSEGQLRVFHRKEHGNGITVAERTFSLVAGENRIHLDLILEPGHHSITSDFSGPPLWRTAPSSVSYPYNSGSFKIIGRARHDSSTIDQTAYYYFFYDMEVAGAGVEGVPIPWRTSGTTTIEGGKITTNSISADSIKTEEIAADQAFIDNLKVTTANITDLTFDKIEGGDGIITNLNVKSTLTIGDTFNMGAIQSYGYAPASGGRGGLFGGSGYRLDNTGITVHDGLISASALEINYGSNLVPAEYADFEFHPDFYDTAITQSGCTYSVTTGTPGSRYNQQHLSVSTTTVSSSHVFFSRSSVDYNVPVEEGKTYIISMWVARASTATAQVQLRARLSNSTYDSSTNQQITAGANTWTRVSHLVTVPAGVTAMNLSVWIPQNAVTIYMDGIQIEEKTGATDEPSPWAPPSSTSINGGMIRTGEIRSNSNVNIAGSLQPMWSINMNGNMQINSALIRGAITLGTTSDATASYIRSANYLAGVRGFEIRGSDGRAEFRNLAANSISTEALDAGNINVSWNLIAGGSIIANGGTSGRTVITHNGMYTTDSMGRIIMDTRLGSITMRGSLKTGPTDANGVHVVPDGSRLGQGLIEFRASNTPQNAEMALESRTGALAALAIRGPAPSGIGVNRSILEMEYSNFTSTSIIKAEADAIRLYGAGEVIIDSIDNRVSIQGKEVTVNGDNLVDEWQTYTPSWTSTGTNPTMGAGTVRLGRYKKVGTRCDFTIQITTGSAFQPGTGVYQFSLPLPCEGLRTSCLVNITASGTGDLMGIGVIEPGIEASKINRVRYVSQTRTSEGNRNFGSSDPGNLGRGSMVVISGTYEVAP